MYKRLENCGFDTNKKIILYAPTWRGNVNSVDFNLDGIKDAISKMSGAIDETRYQICLRVHYYLYEALAKDPDLSKFLVPFTIDTSELLTVTDILITDYSAIFYDFLITQRLQGLQEKSWTLHSCKEASGVCNFRYGFNSCFPYCHLQ